MPASERSSRLWELVKAGADGDGAPVSIGVVCRAAAARLAVTGVAISLRSGLVAAETLCATDELSRRVEELQVTVGEGPSLDVLAGGPSVLVSDLADAEHQTRWPVFAAQAADAGARAVFAAPMRLGAIRGGVLTLYRDRAEPLCPEAWAETWVFASLALQVLLNEQQGVRESDGYPATDNLGDIRLEVHQATGMVAAQLGIALAEAFSRLRARAFADEVSLSQLASDVVARRVTLLGEGS